MEDTCIAWRGTVQYESRGGGGETTERCVGTRGNGSRKRGKGARRDEKGKKGGRIYPRFVRARERAMFIFLQVRFGIETKDRGVP